MLPFIMLVEIVLEIGLFMYQLLRSNKPVRSWTHRNKRYSALP